MGYSTFLPVSSHHVNEALLRDVCCRTNVVTKMLHQVSSAIQVEEERNADVRQRTQKAQDKLQAIKLGMHSKTRNFVRVWVLLLFAACTIYFF